MTIPKYSDLFKPTISALRALGGSGNVQEIYDKVCELENFTEEQQSVLHKNGPQTSIAYRLGWARTYLKYYGAIESVDRGIWSLTDYGSKLTEINEAAIKSFVQKQKRSKTRQPADPEQDCDFDPEPIDSITNNNDNALLLESDIWMEKLLDVLQNLAPDAFERLCQRVLRESGFVKVEVTGRKGDGGIDGIGVLKIALLSFQVFFQCKRYKGSVGPSEIRDFRGSMVGRTDKGLFLTTGTFTTAAKQEATRDGAPALDLIDGEQLCRLLVDLQLGVKTKMIEVVEIHHDWFQSL